MSNLQPAAIFNFVDAMDEQNPAMRTVVVNDKGEAKPLLGVSVVNDSTYQLYEPAKGDIILQVNVPETNDNGEWSLNDITIISTDEIEHDSAEAVLHESIAHATIDFLNNPDITVRHYTLHGVTDTVNGEALTDMYQRRKDLAILFADCEPQTRDNLVNWLDNDDNRDVVTHNNLSWHAATGMPDGINIVYDFTRSQDESEYTEVTAALTWHSDENDETTVVFHSLSGANSAINERTRVLNVVESVYLSDDIYRAMVISSNNGIIGAISLYAKGKLPVDMIPDYVFSSKEIVEHGSILMHLCESQISEELWGEITADEELVNINSLGWHIPVLDMQPNDVIAELVISRLGEPHDDYEASVKVYSNEEGTVHTLVMPPREGTLPHPSVVLYTTVEVFDAKKDEDVNTVRSLLGAINENEEGTIKHTHNVPRNIYTTPVLTADK